MELARAWLDDAHHPGFEGVVAKRASLPYRPGRRAMVKIKHWENEDLVVGGFLGPPEDPACLLVGAFDAEGALRFMGCSARLSPGQRREAARHLKDLPRMSSFTAWPQPGRSRWESHRFEEWTPVAPMLVCEMGFTRLDGGFLRHGCRLIRWRPDNDPGECRWIGLGRPGVPVSAG